MNRARRAWHPEGRDEFTAGGLNPVSPFCTYGTGKCLAGVVTGRAPRDFFYGAGTSVVR